MASLIALSIAIGGATPQFAYAYEDQNSEYSSVAGDYTHYAQDGNERTWFYTNLKNGTIAINGTQDVDSYLEVPQTLDGKAVTVIFNIVVGPTRIDPQYGKKEAIVTKVKLPQTVKIIEDKAFFLLKNLKEIEMPENVKMSEHIFVNCPNVKVNGHANYTNNSAPTDTRNLSAGWNQLGNDRYYVNSSRNLQTGWMDLDGRRYYFYGNGQMAVNFINLGNDSVYYLDPASGNNMGNLVTGWKYVDGYWYYFNSEAKNGKEKGYMQTGWFYNNGSWYYFYGNGQMATGFINLGGDYYYYLDESNSSSVGIMKTGWQRIGGYWFFFDRGSDGDVQGSMKNGWNYIDGNWYYFYSDGKMAYNAWIDGYYVNASGEWAR